MITLEMKNCNIEVITEAAKISESSSGKIHKFKYLTGEEYYFLVRVK